VPVSRPVPERGEDCASGGRGVGRGHDRADDRDPRRARATEQVRVGRIDPADGDYRDGNRRRDGRDPLRTDPLISHVFGARAEHRAAPDVVGALGLEASCGFGIVRRGADQERARRREPGGVDRQVTGAEVDAVGVGGERDVQPIVDEEQRVVARRQLAQRAGLLVQLTRGRGLVSELDRGRAGLERRFCDLQDGARRGELAIRDHDEA